MDKAIFQPTFSFQVVENRILNIPPATDHLEGRFGHDHSFKFLILSPDENWIQFVNGLFDRFDAVVIILLSSNNNVKSQTDTVIDPFGIASQGIINDDIKKPWYVFETSAIRSFAAFSSPSSLHFSSSLGLIIQKSTTNRGLLPIEDMTTPLS
jgi:hypothetical protein